MEKEKEKRQRIKYSWNSRRRKNIVKSTNGTAKTTWNSNEMEKNDKEKASCVCVSQCECTKTNSISIQVGAHVPDNRFWRMISKNENINENQERKKCHLFKSRKTRKVYIFLCGNSRSFLLFPILLLRNFSASQIRSEQNRRNEWEIERTKNRQ